MPHPLKFDSINHITLIVADLAATRRFYCDILGMQQVDRPPFDFPGIWLNPACEPAKQSPAATTANDAVLHITQASDLAGEPGWGDRQVKSLSRGHHFAFEVADAELACDYLLAKGVELAAPLKTRPDGPRQFFIQDPDGHVIEFFSK